MLMSAGTADAGMPRLATPSTTPVTTPQSDLNSHGTPMPSTALEFVAPGPPGPPAGHGRAREEPPRQTSVSRVRDDVLAALANMGHSAQLMDAIVQGNRVLHDMLATRATQLAKRGHDLACRETQLAKRDEDLARRVAQLIQKEGGLARREMLVAGREMLVELYGPADAEHFGERCPALKRQRSS